MKASPNLQKIFPEKLYKSVFHCHFIQLSSIQIIIILSRFPVDGKTVQWKSLFSIFMRFLRKDKRFAFHGFLHGFINVLPVFDKTDGIPVSRRQIPVFSCQTGIIGEHFLIAQVFPVHRPYMYSRLYVLWKSINIQA